MKRKKATEIGISFDSNGLVRELIGVHDEHLKIIEEALGITILVRGTSFRLMGVHSAVSQAERILHELYGVLKRGYPLYSEDVERAVGLLTSGKEVAFGDSPACAINVPARQHMIVPRSAGQKAYVEAVKKHDMVFGIGPAGTGKTYLAMACAVSSLMQREYERIILTRPAVEAGERLGFLPGSVEEKINPYLRPLYDALHDMMDLEQARRMVEDGRIEVAPLAFMRGRTLNSSFVILDEAQNTTPEQMKMFLTRLGFSSKMIITADVTQIDLPSEHRSGALEAERILKNVPGIYFHYLDETDVVRHPLVQKIIKAYGNDAKHKRAA